MESSRRGKGYQEKMVNSVFDPLSWRCLRKSQVEMPCRWLDFGVWRQVLAGVLGVLSLEMVKNGKWVG